ncbi:hypothetical protein CBR_g58822 [Chara braunii]|uniref:Myb/SANT-like DNA-binding domain-containing protein n=1 Tax=Chara braunii TaxID=69332 RepID=A0A388K8E1_CHABU|nr:hypothetical protein CBR_g58822 [Chara braunii]|eukprot:GBG66332.1 hypothetical protein CBR_g58822 [Chara braunii]
MEMSGTSNVEVITEQQGEAMTANGLVPSTTPSLEFPPPPPPPFSHPCNLSPIIAYTHQAGTIDQCTSDSEAGATYPSCHQQQQQAEFPALAPSGTLSSAAPVSAASSPSWTPSSGPFATCMVGVVTSSYASHNPLSPSPAFSHIRPLLRGCYTSATRPMMCPPHQRVGGTQFLDGSWIFKSSGNRVTTTALTVPVHGESEVGPHPHSLLVNPQSGAGSRKATRMIRGRTDAMQIQKAALKTAKMLIINEENSHQRKRLAEGKDDAGVDLKSRRPGDAYEQQRTEEDEDDEEEDDEDEEGEEEVGDEGEEEEDEQQGDECSMGEDDMDADEDGGDDKEEEEEEIDVEETETGEEEEEQDEEEEEEEEEEEQEEDGEEKREGEENAKYKMTVDTTKIGVNARTPTLANRSGMTPPHPEGHNPKRRKKKRRRTADNNMMIMMTGPTPITGRQQVPSSPSWPRCRRPRAEARRQKATTTRTRDNFGWTAGIVRSLLRLRKEVREDLGIDYGHHPSNVSVWKDIAVRMYQKHPETARLDAMQFKNKFNNLRSTCASYTEVLRQGLSGDEGDGSINLSFGLCSGRSSAASRTVIVDNHPDDEGGQVTAVVQSLKSPPPVWEASGNNRDPPRQQYRTPSVSRGASTRPLWMQSPSPLSASWTAARRRGECGETDCVINDVGDAREGREVWAEQRRTLHPQREESITWGMQRLRVGDHENDGDAPAVGADDQEWNDDDGEGGEEDAGHVSPFKQSSMGGRGGKTRACALNGRRGKKAVGKGSDAEADADAEGGRQFWSVDDMIALIRAKRDQDAHLQGMGTAFACMKPREWKWLDVEQRLKKVGVDREAEQCGKKWDNLMQQFKKRLWKGFNFNMDRAVYDEILGSTAKSHTINLKNVADTGSPGGVRLPSATSADHESVGDGDAVAGHDDDDSDGGSTRGSSQTMASSAGFGKRKSTRQQTFEALTECMEKHGALVASMMESNNKRQCSIQIRQCEAGDVDPILTTCFAIDVEILTSRVVKLEVGLSHVMSSRGSGRGKSAGKLAVEAAIREKKGRHVANKHRMLVEGGSQLARNVEDEEWVAEEAASQVESDFEEEEEVSLKRKSSRRGSGALRIEDVGERRGGGGRALMEDVIDVNAAATSRRGGGTAVTQQHRAQCHV